MRERRHVAISESPTTDLAARRASGSSFYTAMRILPRERRDAMFEIYSFCRAVDDVADDGGPRDLRLKQLVEWRADVNALYAGGPPGRMGGVASAMRRFALRREDFLAVIDGMEMDVLADIRAPDWATLDLYCDRVASAVGRLCVRVFGMEGASGIALAHHLGRALQLTNILRDIDEDAAIGRLYLPREALQAAGIETIDPQAAVTSPHVGKACAAVVERARRHFREAEKIMQDGPRSIVRTPRVMAIAYESILDRLVARGWSVPREPVRLSRIRLVWTLLRHLVF
jgi:presqualene diphosphate synthase